MQVRVLFLALKWFRGVSACGVFAYLETAFNLSQILSQKNGLGRATACMNVLVGGGRMAVSKQVADAE
ncbi:MAG: hypothetical protein JRJ80_19460 [Deltaproteobacteria bacterium]|nr:hypothetical protein [Deltaproteobacteria bacterium]